jgi:hypothetical protein
MRALPCAANSNACGGNKAKRVNRHLTKSRLNRCAGFTDTLGAVLSGERVLKGACPFSIGRLAAG